MTYTSKKPVSSALFEPSSARRLCRIVGFACLIAFLVDGFVILLPPNLGVAAWRLTSLQQIGDRGVIILFGLSLLMYGAERRRLIRTLTLICFAIGISFLLSCVVVAQDSLSVQRQANEQISNQVAQLSSQLEAIQNNPKLTDRIPQDRLSQATQRVSSQAEAARQNANSGILKRGALSFGNLVVMGIALLMLGRYGLYLFKA